MFTKIFEKQMVRFATVGVFNTAADFAILNILVFAFSLSKIVANTISILITMSLSYFLNHYIVFRHKNTPSWRKYAEFALLTSVSLVIIQNSVIWFLSDVFTAPADALRALMNSLWDDRFSTEFVRLNSAKVAATVLSLLFNFTVYQKIVFKPKSNKH